MFIILVYDVNVRHVAKMRKLCKKYLHPVQRSVFEGEVTGRKLNQLREEIARVIQPKSDTVCIYEMDSVRYTSKWKIGMVGKRENVI